MPTSHFRRMQRHHRNAGHFSTDTYQKRPYGRLGQLHPSTSHCFWLEPVWLSFPRCDIILRILDSNVHTRIRNMMRPNE